MERVDEGVRRTRVMYVVVSIVMPALVVAVGVWLQWQWRAELPNPVASHWGPGGVADGFSSPGTIMLMTAALGIGLSVFLSLLILPSLRQAAISTTIVRFNGATSLWTGTFLTLLLTLSVEMQRGLADARDANGVGLVLISSTLIATVLAVPTAFLIPSVKVRAPEDAAVLPRAVAPTERLMWSGTVTLGGVGAWSLFVIGFMMLGWGLYSTIGRHPQILPWVGGTIILLAAVASVKSDVLINTKGLTVRSCLRWPRYHVPLDDVELVSAGTIDCLAEFGGWGWRHRPGRRGLVTRNGEVLRVKRHSGGEVVVTVDGATEAASVLAALVGQGGVSRERK